MLTGYLCVCKLDCRNLVTICAGIAARHESNLPSVPGFGCQKRISSTRCLGPNRQQDREWPAKGAQSSLHFWRSTRGGSRSGRRHKGKLRLASFFLSGFMEQNLQFLQSKKLTTAPSFLKPYTVEQVHGQSELPILWPDKILFQVGQVSQQR